MLWANRREFSKAWHTGCFEVLRTQTKLQGKEPAMTPNTTIARTTKTACTAEAEQLLRDAAFVLRLTRRVKDEILLETAGLKPAPRAAERSAAALGV
jgi:hypothetical protein